MINSNFNRSFRKFIDQDTHFNSEEQHKILMDFENEYHQRVFHISITLSFWSLIAGFIDWVLIAGGILASLIMHHAAMVFFLPSVFFLVFNILAKIIFVAWYMKKDNSCLYSLYCAIPYLGGAISLGAILKDQTLFRTALVYYLRYLRKRGFNFIHQLFSQRKNSS